jgi:hypothetical protein
MASRVAMASTSVQETWSGHAASTAALALLTVSNPSNASERLSGASLSAVLPAVDVISTEPSHPSTKQSWKKRRTVEPMVRMVACILSFTTPSTMLSTLGHVLL